MGNVRDFRSRPQSNQPPAGQPPTLNARWNPGCVVAIFAVFLLLSFGSTLLSTAVDWQWFTSLGYQSVFSTVLAARAAVFFGGTVVAALFLWMNWLIARRIAAPARLFPGQQVTVPPNLLALGALVGSLALGLLLGLVASDEWSTLLRFLERTPFGQTDPIFNEDVGFYVFTLPFYEFLRGWALGLLIVAALGVGVIYATRPSLFGSREGFSLPRRAGGGAPGGAGRAVPAPAGLGLFA
jgi:uncharacterized membrane protein (UPF0182 family)